MQIFLILRLGTIKHCKKVLKTIKMKKDTSRLKYELVRKLIKLMLMI